MSCLFLCLLLKRVVNYSQMETDQLTLVDEPLLWWVYTFLRVVSHIGPELPETLKVLGEGQMAHTYVFCYLAGSYAIQGPCGPPFQLARRGAGLQKIFKVLSVRPSVHLSIHHSLSIWFSCILHSQNTSDLRLA